MSDIISKQRRVSLQLSKAVLLQKDPCKTHKQHYPLFGQNGSLCGEKKSHTHILKHK